MKHNEPVTKIMSHNLVTVHHGDPISKVRKLIREHGLHHVPVVNGDQLVGLISWADMLRVSLGAFGADERAVDAALDHTMSIEQLMARDMTTISEHGTIREAAELLAAGTFHSLPVVSGHKLVGMVTTTDLIRYLVQQF